MFISFCGGEGSGKSTQALRLYENLRKKAYEVLYTREPGGTEIGAKIRALLLDPGNKSIRAKTELFLYAADRSQHFEELIKPALAADKVVICDRFMDSTLAYQGFARGLDIEFIDLVHGFIFEDFKPDLTFLLDIPAEKGLQRAGQQLKKGDRREDESRFEREELAFHEKIRKAFLFLAEREKERFCVLDAEEDIDKLSDSIFKISLKKLKKEYL